MSGFNPNLLFFLDRLQGFSCNTYMLIPQNKNTATASDIITVDLPSNALNNFNSFAMHCNAQCVDSSNELNARMPPIADFFERIEVSVGGLILSQGTNFQNVLIEAKKALIEDYAFDSVLSHPEYVRHTSYVDGCNISSGHPEAYIPGTNGLPTGETLFCVKFSECFLGTVHPTYFDCSLIPDIKVRIYCASNNILTTSATQTLGIASGDFADQSTTSTTSGPGAPASTLTGATYQLTDIVFTIECFSLADGTYDNLIASQMNQQGFLEVPYKAYQTFQNTHTGTSNFSVSCASLDRIWLAWRSSDYNQQQTPITVEGHKVQGAFVLTAASGGSEYDIGVSTYDSGSVAGLDLNSEKYESRYFNFCEPCLYTNPPYAYGGFKLQIQLNGAYIPNFQATGSQMYAISRNSLPLNTRAKRMTRRQYLKNNFVQCIRLNMPDSEYTYTLSGLDTRSSNLAGSVVSNGISGSLNPNLTIFVESTEVLRIGSGKSIEAVS